MKTGAVVDKTFNAGVKVGLAIVERKEMQYLYPDASDFVFMDLQTYELRARPVMGDREVPHGGSQASVATHQGVPISVDLPASMVLGVTQTDGGQGRHAHERAEAGHAETGVVVQVPLFVEEGDRVKWTRGPGTTSSA